jgi:hypothetical protein
MPARIVRLRTKADRLRAEHADALRQLVLDYPGLPEQPRSEIVAAIDRQAAAENGWTFVMLGPEQNAAVVSWLRENSRYPILAPALWAQLFTVLHRDTGQIMLTRDELAERLGSRLDEVSRIMHELASIGAIITRREPVSGVRGPGRAVYFMNPNVATHLPKGVRGRAQAEAPRLRTVEPA